MGFVKNAVKSVAEVVGSVFSGRSSDSGTNVINSSSGATPAPAAENSGSADNAETTASELAKRKRGKKSLMVSTSDTSATGSNSTGLNI
ncbi:hypothetical protein [Pectinatus frisingensis]|uniref:hypothetical protein n=1 Tax=Pectinatus frisingensis TaxID=865 RepID=UPI0018C719F6|nr:hypothetical protein [Pectinatus frisingensis]